MPGRPLSTAVLIEMLYPESAFTPFLYDIDITMEEVDRSIDLGPRYAGYRPKPGRLWNLARYAKRRVFGVWAAAATRGRITASGLRAHPL